MLFFLDAQNFSSALGPGLQPVISLSDESSFKIFWIRFVQLMTWVSMVCATALS